MTLQGRDLKLNLTGDDVRQLHTALVQLGVAVPATEQQSATFGPATQAAVSQFQKDNNLPTTGVVDAATAAGISQAVAANQYTVSGTVSSPDRPGVGGLRVQVVDKNVGPDLALGETATDAFGHYQVAFGSAPLRERKKSAFDLQSRVYSGQTFLGASDVRYNASNREVLDVALPAGAAGIASEHDTLTAALAAHYGGALSDLQESDDRRDITYLANKTGWDARAVALAALADQLAQKNKDGAGAPAIDPAFFYALLRAGLPADESAIYRIGATSAQLVWQQAIDQGVIAKSLTGELSTAAASFQKLGAAQALDAKAVAGASPLKDLLALSLGTDSQKQQQFASLQSQHAASSAEFWTAVSQAFGAETTKRLQLDGQMAYLTLNNAPLISRVYAAEKQSALASPLDLAQRGYYRSDKWNALLDGVAIPAAVPGDTAAAKRTNYAQALAAHVRLAYPTAALAEMVRNNEVSLTNDSTIRAGVHSFLSAHQADFDLASQPIDQYIARKKLGTAVDPKVRDQIKRLQRVYQITPSDQAMSALLKHDIHSAYQIVRYDESQFVSAFSTELGSDDKARAIHARARQVHAAVLNIASAYLVSRGATPIGVHSPAQVVQAQDALLASDIVASATLEKLNLSMDYCACDECRSILSPAAYLVNLLQFLDADEWAKGNQPADKSAWATFLSQWKTDHQQAPYPFESPQAFTDYQTNWKNAYPNVPVPSTEITPFVVLSQRRPDIQNLPLTCENTNTPLPYIDLVNETLEYFVWNAAHNQDASLANFQGNTTDDRMMPDELAASPQFLNESVYSTTLKSALFPPPLPFDLSLETVRRLLGNFQIALPGAMEALRVDESIERAGAVDQPGYGWRDILMERLTLSRAELGLLTDLPGGTPTLSQYLLQAYGFPNGTSDNAVLATLANVKAFARRMGVSYADIVEILKTRFVNPQSALIPRLERLHVSFAEIKALKDGKDAANNPFGANDFTALLPVGLDPADYGAAQNAPKNDYTPIVDWLLDNKNGNANYNRIMGLVTITNPKDATDLCAVDSLEFRYANPDMNGNQLKSIVFVRLLRFIRLWKKLGWSVADTDAAITALYPTALPDDTTILADLDTGMARLLLRLGVVAQVIDEAGLSPRDLQGLLSCWSPIDTHGPGSLYRTMFSPALVRQDSAFADDGFGNFLQDQSQKLLDHAETMRGAFGLTGTEFSSIIGALRVDAQTKQLRLDRVDAAPGTPLDANTALTLDNISAVFRVGWLARHAKISAEELTLLVKFTGLDPFAAPEPPNPPVIRLLRLVKALRTAALKPVQALYLLWNQDLSGKSAPVDSQITDLARTLRARFAAIESDFAAVDDPNGDIARARMALVYGSGAADFFFGVVNGTLTAGLSYGHSSAALEQPIADAAAGRLTYDDLGKRLSYSGLFAVAARDAIKTAGVANAKFTKAIDDLYAASQAAILPTFSRYPELLPIALDFGLSTEVPYTHTGPTLAQTSIDASLGRIAYDDARKRLAFLGLLTTKVRDAIKGAPGVSPALQAAVDALYAANQLASGAFYSLLPGFQQTFSGYSPVDYQQDARFTALLAVLLPLLKTGRKRQQALQAVAAAARAGSDFAQAILDDASVLHAGDDPGVSALADLTAVETVAGTNIAGNFRGYVEAPVSGFYNIAITAGPGATITLSIDGESQTLQSDGSGNFTNQDAITLTAARLSEFDLAVANYANPISVKWQTAGRGWEVIPDQYIYAGAVIDPLRAAYLRFLKATALASALKLSASETAWLTANADYHVTINGQPQGWLNTLPVSAPPDATTSLALRYVLSALLDFARLKAALSPDDERVLAMLQDPAATLPSGDYLFLNVTGWDRGAFNTLAARFGLGSFAAPFNASKLRSDFGHIANLRRLFDAYAVLDTAGISAAALVAAVTNEPSDQAVRDLESAVRARYAEADWLPVIKPINDQLRSLRRGALVAWILQTFKASPATSQIDTADKLFEYFLMDVQMDPCMQTSRVRHALSSVQLFIDRCLMNLEPRVAPSAINADEWAWMKRYRVWEANRKVFLWPENWLEPELRDDQSPIFKETMSELLQSDITEDAAEVALLNYLAKLEEVAKLEPCGLFVDEENATVHVIARTAGAHRKYYYRRREPESWTPWEQIKLDIEDNPVLPVVWNHRLLLFWLRITQQGPAASHVPGSDQSKNINDLTMGDVQTSAAANTTVTVRAVLSWSEYYNGKWQAAKTSDLNGSDVTGPLSLGDYKPAEFSRSDLTLFSDEPTGNPSDGLRISIRGGHNEAAFLLYNTHSLPVSTTPHGDSPYGKHRGFEPSGKTFTINYEQAIPDVPSNPAPRDVLTCPIAFTALQAEHAVSDAWLAPFFFADSRNVFYVTTTDTTVLVSEFTGFGVVGAVDKPAHIPPIVMQQPAVPIPKGDPVEMSLLGNPSVMQRYVNQGSTIRIGLGSASSVRFGTQEIGATGALGQRLIGQG